jgi:ketosteroid isomerase-like protein
MSNELQIKALIVNWAAAVRSKNIPAILAHHAADFVMYDVPEPFKSVGLEAYQKTWDLFYLYTEPGVFDILELKIVTDENVAFAYAEMRCSNNHDGLGFKVLDFRLTIGLRKIVGQWTFVHEHHSIPSE